MDNIGDCSPLGLGDTCPGQALPGVPGVSGFVGDGEGGLGAYDLLTWLGNL